MQLSSALAKKIVHSLLDSGQPPKFGAKFINAGTERIVKEIEKDFLDDVLRLKDGMDGLGTCKYPFGPYGDGKTQFINTVRESAWSRGYVCSSVDFSKDECPLDRPELMYKAIASSMEALTDEDLGATVQGLDLVLTHLFDKKFQGFDNDGKLEWITDTLSKVPVENISYRQAVVALLKSHVEQNSQQYALATSFLRGEDVPASMLKDINVFEVLTKHNGLRFIKSMSQIIHRSELATGTVYFFDEGRRALSFLSTKTKKVACENLFSIINECNKEKLPGTMFFYAVTPEFFAEVAPIYPAFEQRVPKHNRIDVKHLGEESELLRKIGDRILAVFEVAFGEEADRKNLTENLKIFAKKADELSLTGTSRRDFVKAWSQFLQSSFKTGKFAKLSPQDVEDLYKTARKQIEQSEKDQLN